VQQYLSYLALFCDSIAWYGHHAGLLAWCRSGMCRFPLDDFVAGPLLVLLVFPIFLVGGCTISCRALQLTNVTVGVDRAIQFLLLLIGTLLVIVSIYLNYLISADPSHWIFQFLFHFMSSLLIGLCSYALMNVWFPDCTIAFPLFYYSESAVLSIISPTSISLPRYRHLALAQLLVPVLGLFVFLFQWKVSLLFQPRTSTEGMIIREEFQKIIGPGRESVCITELCWQTSHTVKNVRSILQQSVSFPQPIIELVLSFFAVEVPSSSIKLEVFWPLRDDEPPFIFAILPTSPHLCCIGKLEKLDSYLSGSATEPLSALFDPISFKKIQTIQIALARRAFSRFKGKEITSIPLPIY